LATSVIAYGETLGNVHASLRYGSSPVHGCDISRVGLPLEDDVSVRRLGAICTWLRVTGRVSVLSAWAGAALAAGAGPDSDPASALQARYAALSEQLEQSLFPQHLYVESKEGPGASQGEVYAVVDYPIATVSDAFSSPANWCDALILHPNVKYCRPVSRDGRTELSTAIGRNFDQPLSSAHRLDFKFIIAASRPDYVDVELKARRGPFGTANYRISLDAVGLENERTFVHLRYSYTYGFVGRLAMKIYLASSGSDKVGFTVIGDPNDPKPKFIGGVRGAIERNTMRYYLAIDAYLGALATPADGRFEQSLERWFNATELYPRQLREIDRDTYFAMKRSEYVRQKTAK
jgi:hypothetical protein